MRVIDENDKCKICGKCIMKDRIWYRDTDDDKIVCKKCNDKLSGDKLI